MFHYVEGVSRMTGRGYISGPYKSVDTASEIAQHGNRPRKSKRYPNGPIYWYVLSSEEALE